MFGTVAIVAALLFVGAALYQFAPAAPPMLRTAQLILALVAGGCSIAQWNAGGDSRWLVGGILLLGAAFPGWAAGRRRALAITALILGVLGTALCGIALGKPMQRAPAITADTAAAG